MNPIDEFFMLAEQIFTSRPGMGSNLDLARWALKLEGHKCQKIAVAPPGLEGREMWLGILTEPIEGHPVETHCLHIKTPIKEVVFGLDEADFEQFAIFCQVVCGTLNSHWLEKMAEIYKDRANKEMAG